MSGGRDARSLIEARGHAGGFVAPDGSRRFGGLTDDAWERLGGAVSVEQAPDQPRFRGILCRAAPLVVFTACLALLAGSDVPVRGHPIPSANSNVEEQDMKFGAMAGALSVVSGLCLATSAQGQELVVNGSFEQSNYAGDCCPICGSGITIPGWEAAAVDHFLFNASSGFEPPPDGVRFVDLNQCSPGSIRQTLSTIEGKRYVLRFMMGSLYEPCFPGARVVRIICGPIDETLVFKPGGGYEEFSFEFTANSNSTTLSFAGQNPGCESAEVDAVSVQPVLCGDIDNSGFADAIDLAIVLANWGAPSPKYPASDINGDGIVNGVDLSIVLSSWGACP
jgi:hypothetical protein